MEGIAALSMACNVLQIIDYSQKVIKTCREIHERGSTQEHQAISENVAHLVLASKTVQDELKAVPAAQPVLPIQKSLVSLAKKCIDIANRLQQELNQLMVSTSKGILGTAKQTIKTLWSPKIAALRRDLANCQSDLQNQVIVKTR